MKTWLVWVVGRHNGGGYKSGELYVVTNERATPMEVSNAALDAAKNWAQRHAVKLMEQEVAK